MSSVSKLHSRAMEFTDHALRTRAQGDAHGALSLFEQALENELAAISKMPEQSGLAWDVLHRSAATLALDCDDFRLAEQLVSRALGGNPHPEIAAELRDVWEQANFHRHLEVIGVELSHAEVQLSLVGRSVANGIIQLSDLTNRMDSFQKLIFRIAQRTVHKEYRSRISKSIQNGYRVFAATPRAGSFAISLNLAHTQEQSSFPEVLNAESVLSEFMDLVELADNNDRDELQERIPDSAYRNNFLGLAKKLAPDGDRIRQVGFTTMNHGKLRTLSVTTPASEFLSPYVEKAHESIETTVEISGVLRFADARGKQSNRIILLDFEGSAHNVSVPPGMMDDIVRPMWNSAVTVRGIFRRKQKDIKLYDIRGTEPGDDHNSISVSDHHISLQQPLL